jgi:hypothetical protein
MPVAASVRRGCAGRGFDSAIGLGSADGPVVPTQPFVQAPQKSRFKQWHAIIDNSIISVGSHWTFDLSPQS